jgi:putative ATP-dependent endonuclease of OLD family
MRLINQTVSNYRSVVDSGEIRIERFQALVGENNSGKSNILNSINAFLTAGAGGINESDFFDSTKPIVITATFGDLTQRERKALRPYLLGEKLILEKHMHLEEDKKSEKLKPKAQYHGSFVSG